MNNNYYCQTLARHVHAVRKLRCN